MCSNKMFRSLSYVLRWFRISQYNSSWVLNMAAYRQKKMDPFWFKFLQSRLDGAKRPQASTFTLRSAFFPHWKPASHLVEPSHGCSPSALCWLWELCHLAPYVWIGIASRWRSCRWTLGVATQWKNVPPVVIVTDSPTSHRIYQHFVSGPCYFTTQLSELWRSLTMISGEGPADWTGVYLWESKIAAEY